MNFKTYWKFLFWTSGKPFISLVSYRPNFLNRIRILHSSGLCEYYIPTIEMSLKNLDEHYAYLSKRGFYPSCFTSGAALTAWHKPSIIGRILTIINMMKYDRRNHFQHVKNLNYDTFNKG